MSLSYSVVIPACNAARTLPEAIESVLQQTVPPRDVIVVDDGSTDHTAAVAQGFSGVRVISQANAGPGPAMNTGIIHAGGDVLAFLDADDKWMPTAMAAQLAVLAGHDESDAAVGDMEEFVCPDEPPEQAVRFVPRTRQPGWVSGATAVRATSFRRVGTFGALGGGHWLDWMDRARLSGLVFSLSNELVLRRRLHGSSLTMNARRGRSLLAAAREAVRRRTGGASIAEEQRERDQ